MASAPAKSLDSRLTSISEQILDLIELAAEVEVQIEDSEEGNKLKHNGKSISDSLEDNYLRLRLWGDNINIDLCDLEIGVENTLYSAVIEIFSSIQTRLDSTKTALDAVTGSPDYATAILQDVNITDLQTDMNSLVLFTKKLNSLAQSINIERAIKSEKGPYGEVSKAVKRIRQAHLIQSLESPSLDVSENCSVLESGDTIQPRLTISDTREERDKKLHYSTTSSLSKDRNRSTYQQPKHKRIQYTGITSSSPSTRASLETNENPSAPHSTESQGYDLRALQEAHNSAIAKIGKLENANSELDRLQKKASEQGRTYKKDYEEMSIKNSKLITENHKLEEENKILKDKIERLEKRDTEYQPDSSATTNSSTRTRRTSPSGSILRSEQDRTLRPPEVRTREPAEKPSSSLSKERITSTKLKDKLNKLQPSSENEEPEGKDGNYHRHPL